LGVNNNVMEPKLNFGNNNTSIMDRKRRIKFFGVIITYKHQKVAGVSEEPFNIHSN